MSSTPSTSSMPLTRSAPASRTASPSSAGPSARLPSCAATTTLPRPSATPALRGPSRTRSTRQSSSPWTAAVPPRTPKPSTSTLSGQPLRWSGSCPGCRPRRSWSAPCTEPYEPETSRATAQHPRHDPAPGTPAGPGQGRRSVRTMRVTVDDPGPSSPGQGHGRRYPRPRELRLRAGLPVPSMPRDRARPRPCAGRGAGVHHVPF